MKFKFFISIGLNQDQKSFLLNEAPKSSKDFLLSKYPSVSYSKHVAISVFSKRLDKATFVSKKNPGLNKFVKCYCLILSTK